MDVVVTQYILGVRPTLKGLLIEPSIPASWTEYTVERSYRGCHLEIQVKNTNGVCNGIKNIYLDGEKIDTNLIAAELLEGKDTIQVVVEMG